MSIRECAALQAAARPNRQVTSHLPTQTSGGTMTKHDFHCNQVTRRFGGSGGVPNRDPHDQSTFPVVGSREAYCQIARLLLFTQSYSLPWV